MWLLKTGDPLIEVTTLAGSTVNAYWDHLTPAMLRRVHGILFWFVIGGY